MGSFADYLEDAVLDHIVGKVTYAIPTCYVALCTGDPTDTATGAAMNEVTDAGAYARVTTSAADWNSASGGAIDNANDITFAEATASWGTVSYFCLVDSGTHGSGNVLAHGQLTLPKPIGTGDTAKFAAGDIDLTLD